MDGENNGKPYEQMDYFWGFPIFLDHPNFDLPMMETQGVQDLDRLFDDQSRIQTPPDPIGISRWWFQTFLEFSPLNLGKIPILTNIFQRG